MRDSIGEAREHNLYSDPIVARKCINRKCARCNNRLLLEKTETMKLVAVFLLAMLIAPLESSADISKLQSQMLTLSQRVTQLEFLKTKDAVRNRYCQIKSDSSTQKHEPQESDIVKSSPTLAAHAFVWKIST